MFKKRKKNNLVFYIINNDKLTIQSYINDYKSFIYTEKIREPNEFELKVYINVVSGGKDIDFFQYLLSKDFDVKNNAFFIADPNWPERTGIVTSIELDIGTTGSDTLFILKGFSIDYYYSTRIFSPAQLLNSEGNYTTNLLASQSFTQLFNVTKSGFEPSTAPGSAVLEPKKELPFLGNSIVNVTNDPTINYSSRLKTSLEIWQEMIEILRNQNIIYIIECQINNTTNKIDFYTFQREDKSSEIEFSNIKLGNVDETKISVDFSNESNTAFVAGQGEGAARESVYIVGDKEKELFKELYVDANDVEDSNELQSRGEAKLAETKSEIKIESRILENQDLKYGDDFKVGDKVGFINEIKIKNEQTGELVIDYNFKYVLTVEEAQHTYEGQYITTDITLGEPQRFITNNNKIILQNAKIQSKK